MKVGGAINSQLGLVLVRCPRMPSLSNAVVPFLLISFVLEKLRFREIILETDLRLDWRSKIFFYKLSFPKGPLLLSCREEMVRGGTLAEVVSMGRTFRRSAD